MGSPPMSSDDGLPFGYSVSDDPLLRPPSPNGDPILGANENDRLGNFFNGMESYGLNTPSYGEGVAFSNQWLEFPPNLLAHSTSFGQQRPPDSTSTIMTALPTNSFDNFYPYGQNTMPPPPARPLAHRAPSLPLQQLTQSQTAPDDFHQPPPHASLSQRDFHMPTEDDTQIDVAALLATLQSGDRNTYPSLSNSSAGLRPPVNMRLSRNHEGSTSQAQHAPVRNDIYGRVIFNDPEVLYTDLMLPPESAFRRVAEVPALQWGSDVLFARNEGFVPPQNESSEAIENRLNVTMMGAFHIAPSTPATRHSSPIGTAETPTHTTLQSRSGPSEMEEDAVTPPSKRRKSKVTMEANDDGDSTILIPSSTAARKRKSKLDPDIKPGSSAGAESSGKRRKSLVRPPRENLTDAQKRENHIKSEQKRRGAIKEGFDDLLFIVPKLQNGGHSKSAILHMTGDWLAGLVAGNQELERGLNPPA